MNVYDKCKATIKEHNVIPKNKTVLVCFSAGKNSSAMLFLLNKYRQEKNFPLKVILFKYPFHVYNELDAKITYWKKQGITIDVLTPSVTDSALNKAKNACVWCKQIRRKLFKEYVKEEKLNLQDVVLATGHGLWDLNAYLAEIQSWPKEKRTPQNERFLELTHRFFPKIKIKNEITFIRPCITINDTEIIELLKTESIPHQTVRCTFENTRPKRLLFKHFLAENLSFEYEETMTALKQLCNVPVQKDFEMLAFEKYLL